MLLSWLEEYGVSKKWEIIMDRRHDSNRLRLQQKQMDLRLRIATVPGVQEAARRNGEETEKNRDKPFNCEVYVTCDDVRCFS